MTRRAILTQAEIVRAIRAADATGKVAIQTAGGIVYADPASLALDQTVKAPPNDARENGGNSCDGKFGRAR